ncbi:MAG: PilZ domain-containing protein [Planctomycetota bacterium]|jgi:hypothetical protein
MADSSASSEKRKFPRLKESCAIRFKQIDSDAFPIEGTETLTVNISGGGICFATDSPVENGMLLAIELTLPEFQSPVVSLGRTVWCDQRDDGKYEVGMEFWWIGWDDDGAQQAISGYIKKALD